jgi:pyruvate dehydrogenase E2 component (dihydrolipoamide acetyltransferase)
MAEFVMPILGADMRAGRLLAWRKKPGDSVRRGDIIAEVETDKADVEVEVFTDGVIEKLLVEPGTEVPVGTPLAIIREEGAPSAAPTAPVAPPAPPAPAPTHVVPPAVRPARPAPAAGGPPVSPAARRLAAERGIDLATVKGTGPGGRIQLRDIEQAAAAAPPPAPHLRVSPVARQLAEQLGIDLATVKGSGPEGRITRQDIERAAAARAAPPKPAAPPPDRAVRMRQAIAAAMDRSNREIPQFQLLTTIDMSRALAWLTAENEKRPVAARFLYGVLLLKAVALALRQVPELNATWADGAVVLKPDVHVGVAIALRGGGLVAPALHHTDRRSLDDLMRGFRDLVQRARAFSLRSSELSEPTITVTSLGEQGVETVYGLIFPPQAAIVGFGKISGRPWSVDGQIASRPLISATLSADHRVTDGHRGSLFLTAIDHLLQEPEKL